MLKKSLIALLAAGVIAIAAPFALDRFRSGALVNEATAAAVAH